MLSMTLHQQVRRQQWFVRKPERHKPNIRAAAQQICSNEGDDMALTLIPQGYHPPGDEDPTSYSFLERTYVSLALARQDLAEALAYWRVFQSLAGHPEGRNVSDAFATAIAVAYMRPFTDNRGYLRFSTSDFLTFEDEDLMWMHERVRRYRNKLIAHSDAEIRRARIETLERNDGSGERIHRFAADSESLDNIMWNGFRLLCQTLYDEMTALDARMIECIGHFREGRLCEHQ